MKKWHTVHDCQAMTYRNTAVHGGLRLWLVYKNVCQKQALFKLQGLGCLLLHLQGYAFQYLCVYELTYVLFIKLKMHLTVNALQCALWCDPATLSHIQSHKWYSTIHPHAGTDMYMCKHSFKYTTGYWRGGIWNPLLQCISNQCISHTLKQILINIFHSKYHMSWMIIIIIINK